MSRQRLAFAWIACFAVLFNMLAMPLSGSAAAQGNAPAEQLLWGSFCSSSGTKLVAISLGKLEQSTPGNDDHSTMQHCWCCAGSASLVALTGQAPRLYLAPQPAHHGLVHSTHDSPTPRQQWPSLNPRASPLV
ncbi:DUF2946 domain-containing protein [Pseudomonas mediterranea]|jgi:hypothetical protein|uniref:DUF2946 domain-containing protein n=1 Tax=Pseudomonas mediterranea TaxID=183795 RepID=A0AAX2DKF2_9PSED|nr:DUF2946 domain-containing protein [Pseudomonas mediterranea]KGU85567.1 hypothetical protein N005_05770 [Pseudomonas mediterranea CFBP 5447]MBL0842308.1 DUF2946 domain-containing protein [Pseudomonas mediterranea]MDU9026725.1 DUF2946 domain-containing protein [Pseudomonas mediterranea]QHA80721.1 DUF2946 domain-containing protein [Pseudomonas mediterranea]UZE01618.1 DUF2946 domain-containing protein [Pseudomonas mediterranea]